MMLLVHVCFSCFTRSNFAAPAGPASGFEELQVGLSLSQGQRATKGRPLCDPIPIPSRPMSLPRACNNIINPCSLHVVQLAVMDIPGMFMRRGV